jgi:hypothetical protein
MLLYSKKKPIASAKPPLKKLLSELEDARNSPRFIQTTIIYNDDKKQMLLPGFDQKFTSLKNG